MDDQAFFIAADPVGRPVIILDPGSEGLQGFSGILLQLFKLQPDVNVGAPLVCEHAVGVFRARDNAVDVNFFDGLIKLQGILDHRIF